MVAPAQLFQDFYRYHGVKRVDTLPDSDPILIKRLPLNSALHVLGDSENPQIDTSNPLLKNGDQVFFHNVMNYDPEHSGGSKLTLDIKSQISAFLRANRQFRVSPSIADMKRANSRQITLFNYAWLDKTHRYTDTAINKFLKFENKLWAVVATIKITFAVTKRHSFILLDVPKELQPKSILDQRSTAELANMAKVFDTEGEQILRHMWLFMNPSLRMSSAFGALTEEELKTTNLMFRTNEGKYTVINLGYLYSWIRGDKNLTPIAMLPTKSYIDVQRYFLRAMMTLQSVNDSGASMPDQIEGLNEQAAELNQEDDEVPKDGERFPEEAVSEVSASGKRPANSPEPGNEPRGTGKEVKGETVAELNLQEMDKEIDRDLQALEELSKARALREVPVEEEEPAYTSTIPESVEEIKSRLFIKDTPEEAVVRKLHALAATGRISASELRKKTELAKASGNRPDPYGSGKSIREASVVTSKDLAIEPGDIVLNVPATVLDASMSKTSLTYLSRKYNTEIINRDILAAVQHLQKGGVIIKNHTVDTMHTALGSYDNHTLEIVPASGMPSIVRARIPKVNEDGTFQARGTIYAARKQLVDRPIRKITSTRVGLTSYYGKCFVDRATKKANSSLAYIVTRLSKATIQPDAYLRDVSPGDVFDNYFEAPYVYLGLSEHFQSFKAGNITVDLNQKGYRLTVNENVRKRLEKDGAVIAGYAPGPKILMIDKENQFHLVAESSAEAIGDIYDLLKLDRALAPVDYAELKVFAQGVPVALFLARTIGFRALVKMLGAKHRIVEGRKQKNMDSYEYAIQFKDFSYIFDRREKVNSLILSGFQAYEKEMKQYEAKYFDQPEIFIRLMESRGLSVVYFREMENLQDMFIDHITERVLKEMGEPTDFNGLVMRACELLTTYYYPASQDADYQRVRGYDRFAGFFYKEVVNSIRAQKSRNSTGRGKVELSPYEVWSTITRDPSVKQAEDINPIQALKISQEAITYVGEGGRSKESMNRQSRAYVESDMGLLSGDSVDSSDVGINAFLSADPEIASLDGLKKKGAKLEPANLLSTSILLAPFATRDDPKRQGFIGIQQGHTVPTDGYEAPMVRTGYESVIGKRTGNMFARVAIMDGTVLSITDKGILVKYKDGTEAGYPLGMLFGKAEGSVYPNTLTTDLKAGQKFKKDDYLTYNTKFFQHDPILPGGIVYKGQLMTRVAFMEVPQTHEDSSSISETLSKRLMTATVKPKTYVVNFQQNVLNLVKVGQKLKPEDILMTIEDEITATDSSFSSNSLDILSERSKNSPKAGFVCTVAGVEVLYHGMKSDMSDSLKALADKSDRIKAETAKSRGEPVSTGYVDSDMSINGTPLAVGKAVIRVHLHVSDDASTGDKVVWGSQIKSVIGEVMPYTLRTESGDEVHGKVGARSFAARIVRGLIMTGQRGTALDAVGRSAVKAYRGE